MGAVEAASRRQLLDCSEALLAVVAVLEQVLRPEAISSSSSSSSSSVQEAVWLAVVAHRSRHILQPLPLQSL
jgi:hypothetical protein